MKYYLFTIYFLLLHTMVQAQHSPSGLVSELPLIGISAGVSLHFISPENISYVDLSSHALTGDLPVKNILRIKVVPDSLAGIADTGNGGVVTIIGETFIAQYRLHFFPAGNSALVSSEVEISPQFMRALDVPDISLSSKDFKIHAYSMLKMRKGKPFRTAESYGISVSLNHISTVGDYVFLDLGFENRTNLAYDIDQLRFNIEDKKINRATNAQSMELKAVWQLYTFPGFKKRYRNIYVLRKATFPQTKVLNITLSETQISGRVISLSVPYGDILRADTF